MSGILMALGARFVFEASGHSFQTLRRSAEYRWVSQPVMNRPPALQFTGPGEETIALEGVIYPYYRGGFGQLTAMRAAARDGETFPVIAGVAPGLVMGTWVIVNISDDQEMFAPDGAPQKVSFVIELSAYGPDAGAALRRVL